MLIRHGLRRQHGVFLIAGTVLLFAAVTVLILTMLLNTLEARLVRSTSNVAQLQLSEKALIAFVAREGRLPCPADGALPEADALWGKEVPACEGVSPSVNYQATGILPWHTLGLKREQVINTHGDYYSYRVFSGPTGFTRPNGADMTPCDRDNTPTPTDPFAAAVDCENATYNNTPEQFILNKGLTVVRADNTSATGVAFVVIDHGKNRRGARSTALSIAAPTLASRPEEVANTAGISAMDYTGVFYARALSTGIDESATSYVDDVLHYQTIVDVARLAGRYARNWPDTYFGGNPNDPSTDPTAPQFVGTSNPAVAGRDFVAGGTGTDASVSFGAGSSSYAGCLWYPVPIPLFDGTNARTFRMSLEFALADNTNDVAAGFTFGFLSATAASGPPTNDLCGNTRLTRFGSGIAGTNTLTLDSTVGVFAGQRVTGTGIGNSPPTLINTVNLTRLTLSANNTDAVSGAIFAPAPVTKTGIGTVGSNFISVSNLTGIRINSLVTGTGVAAGARVMTAAGTTLLLTRPNTGSVSGNVAFSGPTVSIPATGSSGVNTIFVSSRYGLETGMVVTGTGIGSNASISSIAPGSVTLSRTLFTTISASPVEIRPVTTSDIPRDLGWAGGVLGSAYPDRFAVEIDTTLTTLDTPSNSALDPNPERTHFAADYTGVTHNDTVAASCAAAASGAACDSHPSSGSFLVNGISTFHNLRIELIPDQYCLGATGNGSAGVDTVTVLSTAGLLVGMNVAGAGIGANAKIKSIDVPTLTLTLTTPNVEAIASKPLTMFGDSLTQNPSGAINTTSLTALDTSVLAVGMRVSGTGIAPGAEIVSIDSATAVTVSTQHVANVSGAVTFKGRRVVAKAWVLSNTGCAADAPTCQAMKNIDNDFSTSLATNTEALQIAQCIPTPTIQSAYEALYLGLTTANRSTGGATGTNFVARRLFSN